MYTYSRTCVYMHICFPLPNITIVTCQLILFTLIGAFITHSMMQQ